MNLAGLTPVMGLPFVSDTGGEIRHLILFVPAYEAVDFELIYKSLLAQLPQRTDLTIVTVPEARSRVEAWGNANAESGLNVIVDELDITPWARDPHWVACSGDGALFHASPSLDRRDDSKIPALLADSLDARYKLFPIPFEGGNTLISDQHLFVGSDMLACQAGSSVEEKTATLLSALRDSGLDSHALVVVGDTEHTLPEQQVCSIHASGDVWEEVTYYSNKSGTTQPIFHLDHYLTPLPDSEDGRPRVMIGDSRMAAQLLNRPLTAGALADEFDMLAKQLSDTGFEVIRNPLPLIYMDEIESKRRVWYFASSNNVLQQSSGVDGKVVWLPEFGHDNWPQLAISDQANAEIWRQLGYQVRFIPECQRLAENLGGLHCMTSVLRRD